MEGVAVTQPSWLWLLESWLAHYWSCRFLTCHRGWQHPPAFIEDLIEECLMPACLCCPTTLEMEEERNQTERQCAVLCMLSTLRWNPAGTIFSRVCAITRGWLGWRVTHLCKRAKCQSFIFLNEGAAPCMAPGGCPLGVSCDQ